jgi:hypothetical protein
MKNFMTSVAVAAALIPAMSAQSADIGVSIEIAQPGVYGRVDIGRFPQPPAVVLTIPVIIEPPRVVLAQPVQPVYLWVPLGHRKDWGKHCRHYNACGVPVYFVRHDWYEEQVMVPHRQRSNDHGQGKGKGRGKDKD